MATKSLTSPIKTCFIFEYVETASEKTAIPIVTSL